MPSESRNLSEQDKSIKARAHEVYVERSRPDSQRSGKPFPVMLRETPARPLQRPRK